MHQLKTTESFDRVILRVEFSNEPLIRKRAKPVGGSACLIAMLAS
jgi:hypothetical protein